MQLAGSWVEPWQRFEAVAVLSLVAVKYCRLQTLHSQVHITQTGLYIIIIIEHESFFRSSSPSDSEEFTPPFMGLEASLPRSREPVTAPCPKPRELSPHLPTLLI